MARDMDTTRHSPDSDKPQTDKPEMEEPKDKPQTWWEKNQDLVIGGSAVGVMGTVFLLAGIHGGGYRDENDPPGPNPVVSNEADANVDMGLSEPDVWDADVFGSENVLATDVNDISDAEAFDIGAFDGTGDGDGDGLIDLAMKGFEVLTDCL